MNKPIILASGQKVITRKRILQLAKGVSDESPAPATPQAERPTNIGGLEPRVSHSLLVCSIILIFLGMIGHV